MCWNFLRRYWFNFIIVFVLVYGPYAVLRQKMNEREEIQKRLAKVKPTVPIELYKQLESIKLQLTVEKFKSSLLNQELQDVYKGIQTLAKRNVIGNSKLALPSSLHLHLPHLAENIFKPSRVVSPNNKTGIIVAYGVGVNKLSQLSGLTTLLDSLVSHKERDENLVFIIYINIKDERDDTLVINTILKQFDTPIKQGLIDIIVPPKNYYPDFQQFQGTFGDSDSVTIENSKINLDNAFLMMYAQKKAPFYVQLSVNLTAQPHFSKKIQDFAVKKASSNDSWVELSFSMDGCFGKLYRTADLKRLVPFIIEFYKIKPCNWLLFNYIGTHKCHLAKGNCAKTVRKNRKEFRPVLFKLKKTAF